MGQHEEERAQEDRNDIIAVIARCVSRQPEIYMGGHEGYYRHSDIAALIRHVQLPPTTAKLGGDEGEAGVSPK